MFEDLAGDSGFSIDSVEKSSQQNQAASYQQRSSEPAPYSAPNPSSSASGSGSYQQSPQQQGGYQQQPQNQGGYQQRPQGQGGYQQGGYQQRPQGQGGGGMFPRKEDVVAPPYLPIVFFVEKDTPTEVKQKFYHLASKLIGKGYTLRLNPDDPDFVKQVMALSTKNVELYLPWRGFNQLESKHTFNTLTSKDVAQRHFPAWEKIPDAVKAMLANQVRMIFGDRNNSIALMLITYSHDGASRNAEITKDTGRVSFIIKMACAYGFSVVNLGKQSSESLLEKFFDLQ